VWALGGLLIAALSGRPPYEGATPLNVLAKLVREPPRWPSEDRPDVPSALEAIIRRCMARRPEDRYPSAREAADDLERFLRGELAPRRRGPVLVAGGVLVLAGVVAWAAWPRVVAPPPLPPPRTEPPPPLTAPPPPRTEQAPAPNRFRRLLKKIPVD